MKNLKLKDFCFRCERFDRSDFNGYTGCLICEHRETGMYIKGIKYCSRTIPEDADSKQTARKEIIKFIEKNEHEIIRQTSNR